MVMLSINWCIYLIANKLNPLHSGDMNINGNYFISIVEMDHKLSSSQLKNGSRR